MLGRGVVGEQAEAKGVGSKRASLKLLVQVKAGEVGSKRASLKLLVQVEAGEVAGGLGRLVVAEVVIR